MPTYCVRGSRRLDRRGRTFGIDRKFEFIRAVWDRFIIRPGDELHLYLALGNASGGAVMDYIWREPLRLPPTIRRVLLVCCRLNGSFRSNQEIRFGVMIKASASWATRREVRSLAFGVVSARAQ